MVLTDIKVLARFSGRAAEGCWWESFHNAQPFALTGIDPAKRQCLWPDPVIVLNPVAGRSTAGAFISSKYGRRLPTYYWQGGSVVFGPGCSDDGNRAFCLPR